MSNIMPAGSPSSSRTARQRGFGKRRLYASFASRTQYNTPTPRKPYVRVKPRRRLTPRSSWLSGRTRSRAAVIRVIMIGRRISCIYRTIVAVPYVSAYYIHNNKRNTRRYAYVCRYNYRIINDAEYNNIISFKYIYTPLICFLFYFLRILLVVVPAVYSSSTAILSRSRKSQFQITT